MSSLPQGHIKIRSPLTPRRALLASAAVYLFMSQKASAAQPKFQRIPTQFIAALGDPNASAGAGANNWGLWREDPGPRGVWLRKFKDLQQSGGVAPAGWKFDSKDWWLEEHGLIMEAPEFPVPPGRYLVTGGRQVTTVLTVDPTDASGNQNWRLDDGAKLYDVTHLPCRSARYHPNGGGGSPATAKQADFPVAPGAEMPAVQGCDKQDYAVLFVVGVESA
jgi:hypothetical protein